MAGTNKIESQAVKQALKRRQKSSKAAWLTLKYWIWGSMAIALVGVALGIAYYSPSKKRSQIPVNEDSLIRAINSQKSFTASHISNFDEWTIDNVRKAFGGVFWSQAVQYVPVCEPAGKASRAKRPHYDPREKWGFCFTEPYHSGNCSSSYAISVATSLSNRLCMRNPEKLPGIKLSPQDLLSCDTVNKGCKGGTIDGSFAHIQRKGIVTESCFQFRGKSSPQIRCNQKCISEEPFTLSSFCKVVDQEHAQMEIISRGPIVGVMGLRNDFLIYSGGVYRPSTESSVILNATKQPLTHIVKIIGWGSENEVPYWIIENNFGRDWGEGGYARVARDIPIIFDGYMFAGEMTPIHEASDQDEIDLDAEAMGKDPEDED